MSWTAKQRRELVVEHALGRAAPSPDHPGRFEVDLGDQSWSESHDRELLLRFADGAGQPVDRVVRAGPGILVVEVDQVPSEGAATLVASHDGSRLPAAVAEAVEQLGDVGLAGAVIEGVLDAAPSERAGPSYLNDQQRRAVATICEPGVHVVWAPPGTGATAVVAEAAAALARRGRSVLVVAPSASAADDAVERLWEVRNPEPGAVIRVGAPRSDVVADHPSMSLDRAIAQLRKPLLADQARLRRHLDDLGRSPVVAEWASVAAKLDRADVESLQRAWRRMGGPERIGHLESEIARINQVLVDRAAGLDQLRAEAERIEGLLSLDPADVWRRLEEAEASDAAAMEDVAHHDRLRHNAQVIRDAAIHKLGSVPSYRIVERRRAVAEVDHHEVVLAELDEARRKARAEYEDLHSAYCRLRLELQHQLPPECDAEWWADLQAQQATAVIAVNQATAEINGLEAELARLRDELADVRSDPPTPLDYELVEKISPILPELRARREELSIAHERLQLRQAELAAELAEVEARTADIDRRLILDADVVVTTPAGLIDHSAVRDRRFDMVIVDRAASADLPLLVLVASLADDGLTLVGDPCRPGPVVDPRPGLHSTAAEHLSDDARYWLVTEPFHHFGLRTPADIERDRGCVSLTRQYRLGKMTEGLVNRLAYGDVLWSGTRWHDPVGDGQGELVLIDTSALTRNQRWIVRDGPSLHWPLGLTLAGRLLELHRHATIGLVAPHRAQADLLRALAADSGRRHQVEAGTIDVLADRSFDVVVLDLVSERWQTTGFGDAVPGAGEQPSDDLRAAVAALACTRGRVYLIGDVGALDPVPTRSTGGDGGRPDQADPPSGSTGSTGPTGPADGPASGADGPASGADGDGRRAGNGLAEALADLRGRGLAVVAALDLLDDERLLEGMAPVGTSPGDVGKLLRVHPKSAFYPRLDELAGMCRQRLDLWSPYYSERRVRTLGRHWASAARKGRIHARVLPAGTEAERQTLALLERMGVVVSSESEVKERLVIVDRHLVLWGSLNVLSSNRRTELMTEMDSPSLARLLRARADGYPV